MSLRTSTRANVATGRRAFYPLYKLSSTNRQKFLEAEHLVLELADRASLGVSKRLGRLLHGADHGRGAAQHDLDVLGRSREALLDHVRSNESNTTGPALRGVVKYIVDTEAVILLDELLQFFLQQDILGVDVGKDQVHLGGVITTVAGAVADDGLDDLQHGGDTGSSGDHTNVTAHVRGVHHGTLGAAHLHVVADLQGGQVLGNVTLRVGLDEEIKVSSLIVGGDGGVRAHNLLGLAFNGSGERDVLTDGQTQDVGGARQGKAIDSDVVRDLILLLQDKVLELGRVQDLSGFWFNHAVSTII